jgi:hypothetical protein
MGLAVDEAGLHSDITNYYLWIGVIGGLPAMLLLIAIMWRAFVWVGVRVRQAPTALQQHTFLVWCLGAGLLAHAGTSMSMGYTDQSMMFFWLNIAVISSMYSVGALASRAEGRGVKTASHRAGTAGPFAKDGKQLSAHKGKVDALRVCT